MLIRTGHYCSLGSCSQWRYNCHNTCFCLRFYCCAQFLHDYQVKYASLFLPCYRLLGCLACLYRVLFSRQGMRKCLGTGPYHNQKGTKPRLSSRFEELLNSAGQTINDNFLMRLHYRSFNGILNTAKTSVNVGCCALWNHPMSPPKCR